MPVVLLFLCFPNNINSFKTECASHCFKFKLFSMASKEPTYTQLVYKISCFSHITRDSYYPRKDKLSECWRNGYVAPQKWFNGVLKLGITTNLFSTGVNLLTTMHASMITVVFRWFPHTLVARWWCNMCVFAWSWQKMGPCFQNEIELNGLKITSNCCHQSKKSFNSGHNEQNFVFCWKENDFEYT